LTSAREAIDKNRERERKDAVGKEIALEKDGEDAHTAARPSVWLGLASVAPRVKCVWTIVRVRFRPI